MGEDQLVAGHSEIVFDFIFGDGGASGFVVDDVDSAVFALVDTVDAAKKDERAEVSAVEFLGYDGLASYRLSEGGFYVFGDDFFAFGEGLHHFVLAGIAGFDPGFFEHGKGLGGGLDALVIGIVESLENVVEGGAEAVVAF